MKKKKSIVIIGYGSIGQKHHKILKKYKNIYQIYVISKHIKKKFFIRRNLKYIKSLNPHYIVISSKLATITKIYILLKKILKIKLY